MERKTFHLITFLAISMAECLVANKILYCIVLYLIKTDDLIFFTKFKFDMIGGSENKFKDSIFKMAVMTAILDDMTSPFNYI